MPDAAPPAPMTTLHYNANIKQQVVAQLATGSLPAAGTEGRMFADTTLNRYVYDNGSALIPGEPWASSGRVGVSLARIATQSIATGAATFTAISWDTEITDTDAFIAAPSGSVTIPTNRGGIYGILLNVAWASSPGANSSIEILVGATAWRFPVGAGTQMTSCALSVTQSLAAADVVQFRLSQASGGAINVTGTVQMWRLSA